jgi:hypothetical protein
MLGPLAARGDDFFRGQTVEIIVGYSPGGEFDTYSRLIARHLGRHLPGRPTVVVQNMPGAGGLVAANHLYTQAKPDGLTIGAFAAPLVLQAALGVEGVKFDPRRMGWLGVPAPYSTVCVLRQASGIHTVDQWLAARRPVKIAAIGDGTRTVDVPKLAVAALGLPMQVVDGYQGEAEVRLAAESGAVDGYCGSWQIMRASVSQSLAAGKLRPILQVTVSPHHDLLGVPVAMTYARTEAARQLLIVADRLHRAQFLYAVPPGVPPDRLRVLQEVFVRTLRAPALLAEAEKMGLEIEPIDGPTIARDFGVLYDLDAATVSRLREILAVKR